MNGEKLGGSWIPLADTLYKIYFNPGAELGFSTTYTLNLTDGITDMKGNQPASHFSTGSDNLHIYYCWPGRNTSGDNKHFTGKWSR